MLKNTACAKIAAPDSSASIRVDLAGELFEGHFLRLKSSQKRFKS